MVKYKKYKNTKEQIIKGIVSMSTETKKKYFGEHEQACQNYIDCYVKYAENECKFFWLENNMVSAIEE